MSKFVRTYSAVQSRSNMYSNLLSTLKYRINMPYGINVPPDIFVKINKHTPWKIESQCSKLG